MNNYDLLIRKLDEFIRKYYKNMLLKGGISFVAIFLAFYLLVDIIEYFGRFGILTRTVIFYTYVAINVYVLWKLVIIPAFKLIRIGKIISHEQAAGIIGKHFSDVQDKLLNTLQLKQLEDVSSDQDKGLIRASIDQKINTLRPVPFKRAINFRKTSRYLRYVIPPLAVLLLLLITTPRVVTEPATRLIYHNDHFEIPLPYKITILNEELTAIQQDDFVLEIKVEGDEVPAEVFIELEGLKYRCTRDNPSRYHYRFVNIRNDKHFFLLADSYRSSEYVVSVLPRPIILNFETVLDYPAYTAKTDEVLENTGDLVVPEGTVVNWRFHTRDTRSISFTLGDAEPFIQANEASNTFEVSRKMRKSAIYSVVTSNEHMRNKDSLVYSVSVIPDLYPVIIVEEFQDSLYDKRLYFKGLIKDDYGFNKLTFNYQNKPHSTTGDVAGGFTVTKLAVSKRLPQQQYFHYFDLDSIGIHPGDEVSYYFEVWDNDAVNGSKATRSQTMTFKAPTLEEITEEVSESNREIKEEMEEVIEELQSLQQDIEELNRKLLEKENIGWQEKQQIQDLLNRQRNLENSVKSIQDENLRKSKREQQYKKIDEELLRKQQMLEELFNKLMTEDMKKLMEELQKLMDEVDKDKVNEMLEKMKDNNEDLEKQLDRNLELFKQLEFEKMLQDAIDKLDELTEKQEKLSEETGNENNDMKDMSEQQEKLNEEFDKLREELDALHQKNNELEKPNKLDKTDTEEEEIQEEMENSLDELQDSKSSEAAQSQKKASNKMKSLSGKMKKMQSEMYAEGLGEDIDALREILENLIQLSFDQEDLINELKETSLSDPRYVEIIHEQSTIKEDLVMVEDSLIALAKRQVAVKPYVTREIDAINKNIDKALTNLNDRKVGAAAANQQFVMTAVNNLALLLSEVLEQLMSAMQMQSSGQCKKGFPKPGQGNASMKSMRQLQQQLNSQLEQMKKGKEKGKGKPGQQGKQSMSEQLARMAAQQAAIRRMMEQYQEELKKEGGGNSRELNQLMKEMDQTETELVNKIITQETLSRQKEILTRLLKHEKAEMEREREEKRESTEAKDENISNPNEFLEYKRLKSQEVELLKTIPPHLRPYYINKINEYFYRFERKNP